MFTCITLYQIDPTKKAQFQHYALHEGSSPPAYDIPSLTAYEAYRARLADNTQGCENYAFSQSEKFLLREGRAFLTLCSAPHGEAT